MATPLTNEVKLRIDELFSSEEREPASVLLTEECGNNLPFSANATPASLDPVRFAALKLSGGNLAKLRAAVDLAKRDWRDVLLTARSANDERHPG